MALINCLECGKEISNTAESCPNCGFPIKKREIKIEITDCLFPILNKNNNVIFSSKNVSMFPIDVFQDGEDINLLDCNYNLIKKVKIENFTHPFDINIKKVCFNFLITNLSKDEAHKVKFISKCIVSEENFNNINKVVSQYNETQIKCPTCSSINIHKITSSQKITNIALFGLFGNKRKMQFQCNNCKYMW